MAEEGHKSALGWRLIAAGTLFLLAAALGLMSFVFLPDVHASNYTGVVRIALSTADGIRANVIVVAAAFLVLGAVTALGYADRLLKPITAIALVVLLFFLVAGWWTITSIPKDALIPLR